MGFVFVPILAILLHTRQILVVLNQNTQASIFAQNYVLAFLPGLFISGLSDCQRRYLNNFNKNHISFITGLIGVLLHTYWCKLMVVDLKMGIAGIGYANVISQFIVFCLLIAFTWCDQELGSNNEWPDFRDIFSK